LTNSISILQHTDKSSPSCTQ